MENEERREEQAPPESAPQAEPAESGATRSFDTSGGVPGDPSGGVPGGDFRDRPRRRGRRGRGGAQRFGAPQRGAIGGGPRSVGGANVPPRGPMPPRAPMPPRDDEESSQARELAAYERRQQQRGRPAFRGPGWVAGARPTTGAPAPFRAPGAGGFRAPGAGGGFRAPGAGGGFRGGGARPMGGGMRGARRPGGAAYTEQIRRATAGPRSQAAPSHEAGEPIAGPHAILEAIRSGRVVKRLFVSNERGTQTGPVNELIAEAQERRIFVRYVEPIEITRISPIESHQGVVAVVEGKAGVELEELLLHLDTLSGPALVLAIDSLQDPQNFGVLLRSAEGTGVDGVIIPKHRSVGITPAVAKTSSGASEHLMIADVANLRQAIDALKEKGIWVVGTDESGDLLYDEVDYRGPTALVIGGEAEGIRRLVLEGCDQVVRIPMEGQIASLNAAAAGTVVLYEALRQRRRNVAPADTRTPPPPRAAAVTPQEEDMDEVGVEELAESDADSDMTRANDGEVLPIEPGDGNGKPEGRGDRDLARDDDRHDGRDDDDRGAEGEATASTTLADANGDEKSVTEAPKKRAPRAKKATTPRKTTARKKATDERG